MTQEDALKEAERIATRCWREWCNEPEGSNRDRLWQISLEADQHWNRMVNLYAKTPSQQLCIVAQEVGRTDDT